MRLQAAKSIKKAEWQLGYTMHVFFFPSCDADCTVVDFLLRVSSAKNNPRSPTLWPRWQPVGSRREISSAVALNRPRATRILPTLIIVRLPCLLRLGETSYHFLVTFR